MALHTPSQWPITALFLKRMNGKRSLMKFLQTCKAHCWTERGSCYGNRRRRRKNLRWKLSAILYPFPSRLSLPYVWHTCDGWWCVQCRYQRWKYNKIQYCIDLLHLSKSSTNVFFDHVIWSTVLISQGLVHTYLRPQLWIASRPSTIGSSLSFPKIYFVQKEFLIYILRFIWYLPCTCIVMRIRPMEK